jgi:regulatory protein
MKLHEYLFLLQGYSHYNNASCSPSIGLLLKQTVLHCAVGLLARREHSQIELIDKLKRREFLADEIDEAIEQLLEKKYLSDERFAISRCNYRVNRGYGWLYIANELKQKGVSATIIQNLRENCEIDWYLQAELAYNKRFGIKDSVEVDFEESLNKKTKQKLIQKDKAKKIRFLQYRGFSTDEIMTVIE